MRSPSLRATNPARSNAESCASSQDTLRGRFDAPPEPYLNAPSARVENTRSAPPVVTTAPSATMAPVLSTSSFSGHGSRSEEHTSELQSLMRISYAVFCLKKKNTNKVTRLDHQLTSTTHT